MPARRTVVHRGRERVPGGRRQSTTPPRSPPSPRWIDHRVVLLDLAEDVTAAVNPVRTAPRRTAGRPVVADPRVGAVQPRRVLPHHVRLGGRGVGRGSCPAAVGMSVRSRTGRCGNTAAISGSRRPVRSMMVTPFRPWPMPGKPFHPPHGARMVGARGGGWKVQLPPYYGRLSSAIGGVRRIRCRHRPPGGEEVRVERPSRSRPGPPSRAPPGPEPGAAGGRGRAGRVRRGGLVGVQLRRRGAPGRRRQGAAVLRWASKQDLLLAAFGAHTTAITIRTPGTCATT